MGVIRDRWRIWERQQIIDELALTPTDLPSSLATDAEVAALASTNLTDSNLIARHKGVWTTNTSWLTGDIVQITSAVANGYPLGLWRCTTTHLGGMTFSGTSAGYWVKLAGDLDSVTAAGAYGALAAANTFTDAQTINGGTTAKDRLNLGSDVVLYRTAAGVLRTNGKVEVNGGFTNSFDTQLWVAGGVRNNPTVDSNGLYVQHRVQGALGANTHDAAASEIRVTAGVSTGFIVAHEFTSEIGGTGNSLPDVRGLTVNGVFDAGLTGSITAWSLMRAQTLPSPGALTVGTVYGLYVEPQTVGATNYSVYAPTGKSVFGSVDVLSGDVIIGSSAASGPALRISSSTGTNPAMYFVKGGNNRWIMWTSGSETGSDAGSNLQILARSDSGGTIGTAIEITRSNMAVKFGNAPIGFFGTTPANKRGATADATDLASVITLANALKADLQAFGLKV